MTGFILRKKLRKVFKRLNPSLIHVSLRKEPSSSLILLFLFLFFPLLFVKCLGLHTNLAVTIYTYYIN